ncbi:MAG: methyltransferase domain-containing protein [Gammaproteobacteria bacterium]|nr:methyltransferase domain-containing protein [Gammaproteobacteria bacterium]
MNARFDPERRIWVLNPGETFAYTDGQDAEAYLARVLEDATDLSCASEELPAAIRDWPSEYHLSPLRANLLRPLRLDEGLRVLEVGSGCGAITRYLGEAGCQVFALEGSSARAGMTAARCRDLENVTVQSGNFARYEVAGSFDLVTLVGVLEYAPTSFPGTGMEAVQACLRKAREATGPAGTLLIAIENRLGLKYFNGCAEDHTGRRFESINDLYLPQSCRTFGRQELERELHAAGFANVRFLFPFPDYKLPRMLISETALADPELDVGALAANYVSRDYAGGEVRFFDESLAWPMLARNQLVGDLANAFLVLASPQGDTGAWLESDWLASSFCGPRRACYRTENRFRRSGNALRVSKRLLFGGPAPDGPLEFTPPAETEYAAGTSLGRRFNRLAFHPQDAFPLYLEYLRDYVRYLEHELDDAGLLPRDFIDCVPANLVVREDGSYELIDREWRAREPLETDYLLFRAITNDLLRVSYLGTGALFDGSTSLRDFFDRVFSGLGKALAPGRLDEFVDREGRLLEQVAPAWGGPGYAELLRAGLERSPREVLGTLWQAGSAAAAEVQRLQVRAERAEAAYAQVLNSRSFRFGRRLAGLARRIWPGHTD